MGDHVGILGVVLFAFLLKILLFYWIILNVLLSPNQLSNYSTYVSIKATTVVFINNYTLSIPNVQITSKS